MILKLTDGRELEYPTAVYLRAEDKYITIRDAEYRRIVTLFPAQVQSVSWLKEPK